MECKLLLYQSIALVKLYQLSFDSVPIRVTVRPLIRVKDAGTDRRRTLPNALYREVAAERFVQSSRIQKATCRAP